jgi:hypothetical protein
MWSSARLYPESKNPGRSPVNKTTNFRIKIWSALLVKCLSVSHRNTLTFRNTGVFTVRLLALRPIHSMEITPCRMFATAYSMHLQLHFISGDRLLRPKIEDAP